MEWIFNGIGTQILIFIFGLVCGIAGNRFSVNRKAQKAGSKSVQIQSNGNEGDISADKISGDKISVDKIISHTITETDRHNSLNDNVTEIERRIENGSNATRRKLCLNLIANKKPEYLIRRCIKKIGNDTEKYRLLDELAERDFQDTEYFMLIGNSISNAVYLTKAINLYISLKKDECIENAFNLIVYNGCNGYMYKSLCAIYEYNKDIFEKLFDNGACFDNKTYKKRMFRFLGERERKEEGEHND